ncbi:class I SAM-dependent methyltransferase [Halorientalis regularis]|uniref:Cyclopropane-fatty-acyl-phospholipid synthase n=1 Tax=Halorientalis regularis TaxID=660518 RepID=A0A1G7NPD3_9EURY|nr:class I SAM-dependent methyltransferase [Halorientalis regularis]SDF75801.1 cyclopropane-fatty-acyl-phospholipid synthase [Halorientalis regularis]
MKTAVRTNFDESVSAYDAYERRTGRFTALARLLRAEMRRRTDAFDAILDAGAGTGISTRVFADRAARPVALDLSHEMVRRVAVGERTQADFDSLPFTDGAFDAVAFTASLFLTPEPAAAAHEAARVLRPGGVVGAVAPLGWVRADGTDVFADLDRESRSPADAGAVRTALEDAFAVETGVWRFATTAEDVRQFHAIPAMAARLYPGLPTEARVERASELLAELEGTLEQRWRWVVGVTEE